MQRLDRLISDISDASRLDAELARDDAEIVELDDLLRGYRDTYRNISSSGRKKLPTLTFTIVPDAGSNESKSSANRRKAQVLSPWCISGHKGRMSQVIANLIENARSFVPADNGKIDIELKRQGSFAVVTIADNGPGIPPENTERIFERFYTDRPSKEEFGQNSGLGLSITRQIIEAHGGTISADNVPATEGTGAVFTVRLPIAGAAG